MLFELIDRIKNVCGVMRLGFLTASKAVQDIGTVHPAGAGADDIVGAVADHVDTGQLGIAGAGESIADNGFLGENFSVKCRAAYPLDIGGDAKAVCNADRIGFRLAGGDKTALSGVVHCAEHIENAGIKPVLKQTDIGISFAVLGNCALCLCTGHTMVMLKTVDERRTDIGEQGVAVGYRDALIIQGILDTSV